MRIGEPIKSDKDRLAVIRGVTARCSGRKEGFGSERKPMVLTWEDVFFLLHQIEKQKRRLNGAERKINKLTEVVSAP